ncbi:hypothetical protein ACSBR2_009878 [Camellia fascicularis]
MRISLLVNHPEVLKKARAKIDAHPKRFTGREVEGHKLMPFGMGRRACPGVGLAQRVVGLALGSLIQCFEWKRVIEKVVDLMERIGLTTFKVESLETMCKALDIIMNNFLS